MTLKVSLFFYGGRRSEFCLSILVELMAQGIKQQQLPHLFMLLNTICAEGYSQKPSSSDVILKHSFKVSDGYQLSGVSDSEVVSAGIQNLH